MSQTVEVELEKGHRLKVEDANGEVIRETKVIPEGSWKLYRKLERIRGKVLETEEEIKEVLDSREKQRLDKELMSEDLKSALNEKWHDLIPVVGRLVREYPSESRPTVTHEVYILPNDELACTCEAFQYNRTCKHVHREKPTSISY